MAYRLYRVGVLSDYRISGSVNMPGMWLRHIKVTEVDMILYLKLICLTVLPFLELL